MINKYTLIFKDAKLENIYQEYMTTIIRKPLLMKIIVSSIILTIIDVIEALIGKSNSVLNNTNMLIAYSSFLTLNMLFIAIYCYKPKYSKWALLIYNNVLVVLYCIMQTLSPKQQLIVTIGIICVQIVNALSGEFSEAVYQTVGFGTIYLSLSLWGDHCIKYSLVAVIIVAMIVLISAFYENIKALRSQFKLGNIDNQWEQIFTSLVRDQYVIFYFNEDQYSFTLKNQLNYFSNIKDTKDLRQFLRRAKLTDKQYTLEESLFRTIKDNQQQKNIINSKLTVALGNETHNKIVFSIFYGVNTILLLQIQTDNEIVQKNNQQSLEKLYQYRYKSFLKLMEKLIRKTKVSKLSKKTIQLIYQIRKHCLYAHLKEVIIARSQFLKSDYISEFFCGNILRTLQSIYYNKVITWENELTTEIIGCKQIILIILIEIIEKSLSPFISLRFDKISPESLQIRIYCLYNEKQNRALRKWLSLYPDLILHVHFLEQYICVIFKTFTSISQFKILMTENLCNTQPIP